MTTNDPTGDTQGTASSESDARGLICRQCGCRHFNVYYTRQKGNYILRVRICRYCGRKLTTHEKPAGIP